jgi:hypothetical protein
MISKSKVEIKLTFNRLKRPKTWLNVFIERTVNKHIPMKKSGIITVMFAEFTDLKLFVYPYDSKFDISVKLFPRLPTVVIVA